MSSSSSGRFHGPTLRKAVLTAFAFLWAGVAAAQSTHTGAPSRGGTTAVGGGVADQREAPLLKLIPKLIDFEAQVSGTLAADQTVRLRNTGAAPVTIDSIVLEGVSADFTLSHPTQVPFVLAPGAEELLSVGFAPVTNGGHATQIVVVASSLQFSEVRANLAGFGLGQPGAEILMNCASGTYLDAQLQSWSADAGAVGGLGYFVFDPIGQTDEDALFQTARLGSAFGYDLPVPNGWYEVTLHFAETQKQADGVRLFDVALEGQAVVLDLDLFAVAGHDVAHSESALVEVADGRLNIDFEASVGEALLAAFEVRSTAVLAISPSSVDFEGTEEGQTDNSDMTLTNVGGLPLTIDSVLVAAFGGSSSEPFTLDFEGALLAGSSKSTTYPVSKTLGAGESLVVPVEFAPVVHDVFQGYVEFDGADFDAAGVLLYGLAGSGHPFLHVVTSAQDFVVDYDNDGFADVLLDGTLSHTHEFGHDLVTFDWSEGVTSLGSAPLIEPSLPVGAHTLTLTIGDDNVPPETLSGDIDVQVAAPDAVPGVVVRYYDGSSTPPATLLDAVPANPDFVEIGSDWAVLNDGTAGASPFTADVMVTIEADIQFDTTGTWVVLPSGGDEQRLFIDQVPITTATMLSAGAHHVEARFAVTSLATLPLRLKIGLQGTTPGVVPSELSTHDETGLAPLINSLPTIGSVLGGNDIVIEGVGFFPADSVTVHWGAVDLTEVDFDSITSSSIRFSSPPHGAGNIAVTVETPNGTSPAKDYAYTEDGPVQIAFDQVQNTFVQDPTTGDWGPDGRFYVASRLGQITAIEFDAAWNVLSSQTYNGVSNDFPANEVLGLCFNPFDDPQGPVRIYVARSDLYAQNGSSFSGPAPYDGKISILEGPNFDTPIELISGLPLSNHDHGINGMQFDNNGDLLLTVGGNTNAGIKWPNIGDVPASPFSGAILKAETSKAGFNGQIVYVNENTGLPDANSNDMVFGLEHAVQDGVDIEVQAPGMRNAYDIVYTTRRYLYGTDNGPNFSFGPASTGPATQDPDPQEPDEINLIEFGNYYGHPNHNRAESSGNEREYVYYDPNAPKLPSTHMPPLSTVNSSTDGIVEFRGKSFGNQMRGNLLVQQWGSFLRRVQLSIDGRSVDSITDLMWTGALDVQTGPGGALLGTNYSGNSLKVFAPNDLSLVGLKALDIYPWRAPATGGARFTIGGSGFGDLAETSVTIGGRLATLTSVTPTRIVGTVPAEPTPPNELVDVVVTVDDGQGSVVSDTLTAGFFYLGNAGEAPGFWESRASMPVALGDVASGEVGGLIYVIGEGSPDTYRYNTNTDVWPGTVARRPLVGSEHSVEVIGSKLYVVGGLGAGSEGKVQIFTPATNSWALGADMPWAGGAVSTATIDGKIYAAGGIVGSTTVDDCAVYDPDLDTWTALAPMPLGEGRNHASAGTDGERLWIFGGRGIGSGPCDCLANGFDDVHVYDPVGDSWESSLDMGSSLAELPVGRGGLGRAIFHQGEFYVMGGETLNGAGATLDGVFARVDVYDPETNTWRQDADMLTPRHGVDPIVFQGLIYVPGGGTASGPAPSASFELLNHQ